MPYLYWGTCVPARCTGEEVSAYYSTKLPASPGSHLESYNPNVDSTEFKLETSSYVFIAMVVIVLVIVTYATVVNQTRILKRKDSVAQSITSDVIKTEKKDQAQLRQTKQTLLPLLDAVENFKLLTIPKIMSPSV